MPSGLGKSFPQEELEETELKLILFMYCNVHVHWKVFGSICIQIIKRFILNTVGVHRVMLSILQPNSSDFLKSVILFCIAVAAGQAS